MTKCLMAAAVNVPIILMQGASYYGPTGDWLNAAAVLLGLASFGACMFLAGSCREIRRQTRELARIQVPAPFRRI